MLIENARLYNAFQRIKIDFSKYYAFDFNNISICIIAALFRLQPYRLWILVLESSLKNLNTVSYNSRRSINRILKVIVCLYFEVSLQKCNINPKARYGGLVRVL